MRRMVLLVAVAVVMAMMVAGPADASTSGVSQSVGGGGSVNVGGSSGVSFIGNSSSTGDVDFDSGFSNIASFIIFGDVGDVSSTGGDFDVDF